MARETSLWQRVKRGSIELRQLGYPLHISRIENAAGAGQPDVEGCFDGPQVWMELKSCLRPARAGTSIRPKKRESQEIWHRDRTNAGGRHHWILIQVGEAHKARLYLIPGSRYADITTTEDELRSMSAIEPTASPADVLLRARLGW